MAGWIKFHRRALTNPCLRTNDELAVWCRLLAMAAWEPTQERIHGVDVRLEPGQVAISVISWAEKVGLSHKQLRTILKRFLDHGMIEMGKGFGKAFTLITICNYVFYQQSDSAENDVEGKGRAKEGQRKGKPYKKEDKNLLEGAPAEEPAQEGELPLSEAPSAAADGRQEPPAAEAEAAPPASPARPPSAKKALWDEMLFCLGGNEQNARKLIGKWVNAYGDGTVFAAHFACRDKEPAEYVSYMEGILRKQPYKPGYVPKNGPPKPKPPGRSDSVAARKRAAERVKAEGLDPNIGPGVDLFNKYQHEELTGHDQRRAAAA